jgi:hypothetical protein
MKINVTALKEEERRALESALVVCGYRVWRSSKKVPNGKTSRTIFYIEYEEMNRDV